MCGIWGVVDFNKPSIRPSLLWDMGKTLIHRGPDDEGIVFNGEIYNFQNLKRELEEKGHFFKSKSDTEVILHAYEEWGIHCLKQFRGMFAFALWDLKCQRLFLAGDR